MSEPLRGWELTGCFSVPKKPAGLRYNGPFGDTVRVLRASVVISQFSFRGCCSSAVVGFSTIPNSSAASTRRRRIGSGML